MEEKRPVCCSQPATQSPPCCHGCLTNISVRGYEKSPQYYFLLLKCASSPPSPLAITLGNSESLYDPRMTAPNKSNDLFLFFLPPFLKENDLNELRRVSCAAFQSKTPESQICDPELFRAYLHNCNCTCNFRVFHTTKGSDGWTLQQVSTITYKWPSEISPLFSYKKKCLHFIGLWISFST